MNTAMVSGGAPMGMQLLESISGDKIKFGTAKKELGLGLPPTAFGVTPEEALAAECSPQAKVIISEAARWLVDVPVADTVINTTFGNSWNVFGTPDGVPPPGVTLAKNTLNSPGILPQDMLLRGISVRFLVEPEARLIKGGFLSTAALASIPMIPDVWTNNNDLVRALGLAAGQNLLKAMVLYGYPTWKTAYAWIQAMELVWSRNHQEAIVREPLTQVAHIEPFAEAEAAGNAFTSNIDRISLLNQRLINLLGAGANQFLPISHKRLGSITDGAGLNAGIFTVTGEEDGSTTMFGGIGVPQNMLQHDPYLFSMPVYWPQGSPMGIKFDVQDQVSLAEAQRWMSITGGSGGTPGTDLAMIPAAGLSAIAPTVLAGDVALEQTDDLPPITVGQQQNLTRALLKIGRFIIEVGLIGRRIPESWKPVIYQAVRRGAIAAPQGLGNLPSYATAA